jgi:tetratricopeptide (TPR) repeat protein
MPVNTKILLLAANPHDTTQLQLDEEVRAIDLALRQAQFRDQYTLLSHWAVRVEDLQELLLRHQPDIVHFSGHATADSGIILQTAEGGSVPVPPEALSKLFELLKDNIRCVVLNACYSAPQAEAIAQQIDVVIGMSNAITDDAAINFAAAFYRALGFGRSIKTAFELGRNQIGLAGLREEETPQLLALRGDPARITLTANLLQASRHYVWGVLTLIPLLVLLYYLSQILFRWIDVNEGIIDFVLNLPPIVALVLALLGVTTEWGRQVTSALWDSIVNRFPPMRHSRNVFFAVTAAAIILGIGYNLGAPALARYYNDRGLAALDQGERAQALQALRRSVSIAPRNGRYHYNLGLAYEVGQQFDQAIVEYQQALDLDENFWPVYNNLGRLLLKEKKKPDEALPILLAGVQEVTRLAQQPNQSQETLLLAEGVLRKNIGWAYLEKGLPQRAVAELTSALERLDALEQQTQEKGVAWLYLAESYRFLALAYEQLPEPKLLEAERARGNSEGYALAIQQTEFCTQYGGLANVFCLDAQLWAAEAAEPRKNSTGEK